MKPSRPAALIVEDQPFVGMVASDILRESGFDTFHAYDASDATAVLEAHPEIEVVVTDGRVKLDGSVDSRMAKYQIEDLIETFGVADVHNNLRVQSDSSSTWDRSGRGQYGSSSYGPDRDRTSGSSATSGNPASGSASGTYSGSGSTSGSSSGLSSSASGSAAGAGRGSSSTGGSGTSSPRGSGSSSGTSDGPTR